jgi:hypothetical protein
MDRLKTVELNRSKTPVFYLTQQDFPYITLVQLSLSSDQSDEQVEAAKHGAINGK